MEAVKDLDHLIQAQILSYVDNGAPPSPSASSHDSTESETLAIVDDGFVYIEHQHSGMQTETGDYVMYGHIAIPASFHSQLMSSGLRPSQLQEALEKHDSNPDRAIDWLLEQQLSKTEGSFVLAFPCFCPIFVPTILCILPVICSQRSRTSHSYSRDRLQAPIRPPAYFIAFVSLYYEGFGVFKPISSYFYIISCLLAV